MNMNKQNIILLVIAILALLYLLPFPFKLQQKKESCCGVY